MNAPRRTNPRANPLVVLTPSEKRQLQKLRDSYPSSRVRDWATAILELSKGKSIRSIALSLSPQRTPSAIRNWLNQYIKDGVSGFETVGDAKLRHTLGIKWYGGRVTLPE